MRRHFHDHPSQRYLFGGVLGLALASLTLVACDHAQSVKDLRKNRTLSTNPEEKQGENPIDLNATWIDLPDDSWTGEAFADENDRISCGDTLGRDFYVPDPSVVAQAQSLLQQMDINQKVRQLTGVPSPDYNDGTRWQDIQRSEDEPPLNIRGMLWRDGPHGLNLEAGKGRNVLEDYSTSFPTSISQGASFDTDVVYRVGEAMGDEVVAAGQMILLAPCMNILRHPYWGRANETFGEDSFHLGRIATALTLGLQEYVGGCAKHFAANNVENQRFDNNAAMDEQTLREVYGRHFEMVVRDGGVSCVMAAYNSLNNTKCTQNGHLLTDMLRNDMGFKGFVVSDWWAMPGPGTGQGPIDPPQDQVTAADAIRAGLTVEVPWRLNYDAIPWDVENGALDVALVDQAVLRVLEQKLRFHMAYLDQPQIGLTAPTTIYVPDPGSIRGNEAHVALAQELAEKAMVLLKNNNSTLPIPSNVRTVAVIGATVPYSIVSDRPRDKNFDFAREAALGDRGSSRVRPDPSMTLGPLDGITAVAPAGVTVIGGATAADAASADFVVVVVGLTPGEQGEEYTGAKDRNTLALQQVHNDLVNSVVDLGKPTVVVVESGSVVAMPWLDRVGAAVMAWFPGQKGGAALGRLLFGQTNFAGRLPVTWPASEDQLPTFNEGTTTNMDYYLGYRRFDKLGYTPLYAFGHGLSYSTFRYERLHIPCADITDHGLIQVEVDVRNTAGPAGDEVIFVFASYPETTARRSVKELKGFARIHLEPGKGKRVSIPVRVTDLKYWDMGSNSWVIEKGPVLIQVGPSSDNLLLQQTFTVQ